LHIGSNLPPKDNLRKEDKSSAPKVSFIRRFHCIPELNLLLLLQFILLNFAYFTCYAQHRMHSFLLPAREDLFSQIYVGRLSTCRQWHSYTQAYPAVSW